MGKTKIQEIILCDTLYWATFPTAQAGVQNDGTGKRQLVPREATEFLFKRYIIFRIER